MYRLINQHCDAVVNALGAIGDINDYLELRRRLTVAHDAALDPEFQRAYRKYWRMNPARLGDDFYKRYFDLLAETQRVGKADLAAISKDLGRHASRDGLQFSFATKLAHMVDPTIPVYDSFVASFYFYQPPPATKPKSERLAGLLSFHDFLVREYDRIIFEGRLDWAIRHLRASRGVDESIPAQRIIDWLLWSWVSLLRSGAQPEGRALFE